MKISVNDVELFRLSEIQKDVIKNDIASEIFDEDMARRLQYILTHKYERCFDRLKKEWDAKLVANGVQNIPLDRDAYAQLVFAQPNYKNRSMREAARVHQQIMLDSKIKSSEELNSKIKSSEELI